MNDFFFSKRNLLHTLTHILTGSAIANVSMWIFGNFAYSFVLVFAVALAIELDQLRYHDWDFLGYNPPDQIRDFLEYNIGALTCLLWLI